MSYCVHCGVKLAEYHEKCPICDTKVMNPNTKVDPLARDFPKYREHFKVKDPDHMKRLLAGIIISFTTAIYIVVLLLINFLVNGQISWSLIPCLSLVYVWFAVALPLLRSGQTFFRLYTYDTIATALYLIGLNFIISGNIAWAQFASSAIVFVWAIMAGIFISDRVKKWIPMLLYYIIVSVLFTALFAFLLTNNMIIMHLVLPIYLAVLFFSLSTFFTSRSMIFDIFNFLAILFGNVASFN